MTIVSKNVVSVCHANDLIPNSGIAVLHNETQIAVFYVPHLQPSVYAIANYDPLSDANVLARGIVGDCQGELCVASPIYKQHFNLRSGQCMEEPTVVLQTWPCRIVDGAIALEFS